MNEIITRQAQEVGQRLAVIEYRIQEHINGAADHVLGIGKCLVEAKDSGLVPHGEWAAWVERNTGMSVRQAQRLMQAAREVPEDSTLARLPFSKIQACLQLPSGEEREAMAQRAQDEDMSLRELQAAIQQEKARADSAQRETAELRRQLAAAPTSDDYISPGAQAEIDRLRAELADAEAMAERQADLRQQSQQELLNLKAQAARGETAADDGLTPYKLNTAVQAFIGSAGVLPHMGAALANAGQADKAIITNCIDAVDRWVNGARRALQTIIIDE